MEGGSGLKNKQEKIITNKIISNEPHNHLNSKINKRRTILKSYNLD